jgi:hypothetical protein
MTKYREPLKKALRSLIDTIDTMSENSDDPTVKAFTEQIDELIGRTMAGLKSGANRTDKSSTTTAPATE